MRRWSDRAMPSGHGSPGHAARRFGPLVLPPGRRGRARNLSASDESCEVLDRIDREPTDRRARSSAIAGAIGSTVALFLFAGCDPGGEVTTCADGEQRIAGECSRPVVLRL